MDRGQVHTQGSSRYACTEAEEKKTASERVAGGFQGWVFQEEIDRVNPSMTRILCFVLSNSLNPCAACHGHLRAFDVSIVRAGLLTVL